MWARDSSAAAITVKPSSRPNSRDATGPTCRLAFGPVFRRVASEPSPFGVLHWADDVYGASPQRIRNNTTPLALNRIAWYFDAVLQNGADYIGATTAAKECASLDAPLGPRSLLNVAQIARAFDNVRRYSHSLQARKVWFDLRAGSFTAHKSPDKRQAHFS